MFKKHRFRAAEGARDQRGPWTDEELVLLLLSPVWTGCQRSHRSRPGPHIIRDAKFWIPLLALFHGARLEEFADLYRRDMGCENGTWFFAIRVSEREDGHTRRIKTASSKRKIPIHPALLRMGLIEYVAGIAPMQRSPLFPDLPPQGKDGKRGPRITRWFAEYRKAIGVFRKGIARHSFRHNANTRLRGAATNKRQQRHVDYMFGWTGDEHRGGGEGRVRYDHGPPPSEAVETLVLLQYPELDLSKLYGWRPS